MKRRFVNVIIALGTGLAVCLLFGPQSGAIERQRLDTKVSEVPSSAAAQSQVGVVVADPSSQGVVDLPPGDDPAPGRCTWVDSRTGEKHHGTYSSGGGWCCWTNASGNESCGNCQEFPAGSGKSACSDGWNVVGGGGVDGEAIVQGSGI